MPIVYLSPSTQEFNRFIIGGDEEYYMNQIVDAMIPYLRASGIDFVRNNPGDSISRIIERSNELPYNLHLALHSRGTTDGIPTEERGVDVYHYAVSPVEGEIAAYLIAENLRNIYPAPNQVAVVPDLARLELSQTNAPAVLVELGYDDNYQDALWIKENIEKIGRNLALSVAGFLQVPFIEPPPSPVLPPAPPATP